MDGNPRNIVSVNGFLMKTHWNAFGLTFFNFDTLFKYDFNLFGLKFSNRNEIQLKYNRLSNTFNSSVKENE